MGFLQFLSNVARMDSFDVFLKELETVAIFFVYKKLHLVESLG